MIRTNDLLKNVLIDIEEGLRNGVNSDVIAKKHTLSSIHLQRLFKYAFKQSLGAYIRSRKLKASLESLLNTKSKLLDIALDYGFEYEQSYLRSFKREFGVTPGRFRKMKNFTTKRTEGSYTNQHERKRELCL
jgi:AraC family transcriptional regulator